MLNVGSANRDTVQIKTLGAGIARTDTNLFWAIYFIFKLQILDFAREQGWKLGVTDEWDGARRSVRRGENDRSRSVYARWGGEKERERARARERESQMCRAHTHDQICTCRLVQRAYLCHCLVIS